MKKTCIAITMALVGMMLTAGALQAQEACSDPAQFKNFTTLYSQVTRLAEIQKRLDNPAGYPELLKNGRYELCIQMAPHLVGAFATEAAIIVKPANLDIVVVGLNLMKNVVTDKPLVIVRNTGTKKVEVRNLSLALVKNGLSVDGTGSIEIAGTTAITGDGTKSGTCIDVKAPNAIISGVTVSSCDKGILVEADGVKIQDKSVIKENKIGVDFNAGIKGSVVTEALVYLNDDGTETNLPWNDGIRLEGADPAAFALAGGNVLRPAFYDVEGADAVPVDDDPTVTTPYVFKGKNANILVDDLKEYFKTSSNTIEVRFADSEGGERVGYSSRGQSCDYTALGSPLTVTIDAANFDEGKPVTVAIPDEFANKALAVLYSDSEMGTLGFSRPFKVSPGGVVAFVATPYDIPTTSGETSDDSGDSDNTAGDSMGGDNTMAEGAGDGLIEAAGPGAKCTFTPHARSDGFSVMVDLLWLLLIVATLFGSRLLPLPARISQRIRRRK